MTKVISKPGLQLPPALANLDYGPQAVQLMRQAGLREQEMIADYQTLRAHPAISLRFNGHEYTKPELLRLSQFVTGSVDSVDVIDLRLAAGWSIGAAITIERSLAWTRHVTTRPLNGRTYSLLQLEMLAVGWFQVPIAYVTLERRLCRYHWPLLQALRQPTGPTEGQLDLQSQDYYRRAARILVAAAPDPAWFDTVKQH